MNQQATQNGAEGTQTTDTAQRVPGDLTLDETTRVAEAEAVATSGDYAVAMAMFREILDDNPVATPAIIGIGDIYLEQEDYSAAEPVFARAARLEPRNFSAQFKHGIALQMLDRLVEAVRAYHRALTIKPNDIDANLNIATTYLQMGEPRSAVTFAERVVELSPSNGPAQANLGAAYEQLDEPDKAISAYITAAELMEPSPALMRNLLNMLASEGRYREAVNTAENLLKLEESAEVYERLGWAYFRLGEYDRSVTAYERAVALQDDHWRALNGLAVNALNQWLVSEKRDTTARLTAQDGFRRSLRVNKEQPKVISLMLEYGL